MRIIFVRHGEPDYSTDSLTENGKKEAEALAERTSKWNVDKFYVSPQGRAKETAAPTLKKMGREAVPLHRGESFLPVLRQRKEIYVFRTRRLYLRFLL